MPDSEYDALFSSRRPRDRVYEAASRLDLSPDIADDYLRLTKIESGHNLNVRDSPKGAKGFGQVMPDVPGGSTRTIGGRRYNLRDPDENIEAGLRYFSEGGSDPVERRLYYFGGPRARDTYRRTGRIPNISDGNMTAAQYVAATGGQQRPSRPEPVSSPDPYDVLFSTEQAPSSVTVKNVKSPVTATPPATTPAPSSPFERALGRMSLPQRQQVREVRPRSQVQQARPQLVDRSIPDLTKAVQEQPLTFEQDRAARARQQQAMTQLRGRAGAASDFSGEEYQNFLRLNRSLDSPRQREAFLELKAKQAVAAAGSPQAALLNEDVESARRERVARISTPRKLAQIPKSAAVGLAGGVSSSLKGVATLAHALVGQLTDTEGIDTKDTYVYRLGEYIQQRVPELVKSNPDLEQEFLVGKAPATVGQVAQFLLGGWASKSPKLAVAIMGGTTTAGDAYDEVRRAGGTDEEATNAGLLAGAILGPTELIGMRGAMKALSGTAAEKTLREALKRSLKEGTKDAAENALQEVGQEYLQGRITGERRSITELLEAGILGGIGGTVTAPLTFARRKPQAGSQSEAKIPVGSHWRSPAWEEGRSFKILAQKDDVVVAGDDFGRQREIPLTQFRDWIKEGSIENVELPAQTKTETQPKVETQVAVEATQREGATTSETQSEVLPVREQPAQRFYHRDFGEVVESGNQSGVGERRVRVTDADGNDHIIKRTTLTGRGNERAVPIREPVVEPVQPERRSPARMRDADWLELTSDEQARVRQQVETEQRNPPEVIPAQVDILSESTTRVDTKEAAPAARPRAPESSTSARKSQLSQDRAELDLPELPPAQRKSWQQSLSEAKPEQATRLADEVLSQPRALNDSETASLVVRAQQVKNEHAAKLAEIADANPDALPQLRSELETIEREFDSLTRAAKSSGTEKGRTLAAQKLTINQDYDLVSLVSRAKAAKGRELTTEERQRYESMAQQISRLEADLASANERLANQRLQKQVDTVSRREKRAQSRQALDEEFADLRTKFAQARAETKGVQASGLAGLDPEGKLTRLIAQMARNRIQAGVTDAAQVVDAVYAAIAAHLPEVSKRDIRDAISGYSIAPKTQRSRLQKQLDELRSELQRLSRTEDIEAGIRSPRREGPIRSEAQRLPMEGPRKSDIRQVPAQGPRMSEASRSGVPLQGPKLSDVRRLPVEGPKPSDIRRSGRAVEGPRMVEHGPSRRFVSRNARRQQQITRRIAELERRLREGDFSVPLKPERLPYTRETARLERQLQEVKAKYEAELHRAQRGPFGTAWDVGVNIANIPKTLKSMGDISALLRQGGYYSITHPVLSTRAAADMFRSFTEAGFKNVEHAIKTHPDFELAKRSGVEFTGVDKESIPLSSREEAYLSNFVSKLPIAKQSEQTFVAFLDSQRMQVFARLADELRARGLSPERHANEFRAIARLVNIGTGRGSLGRRGNQIAPALNTLMFSPRLLASRVQLLNNMLNPVAIQRTPPAARSRMIKDNVKFAGTIATVLGLAAAAGAKVSRDPDDADFLKIRIGNSRYDILTGIQQPLRFMWRMARAVKADLTRDETYAGENKGTLVSRFARSKASPMAGVVADYFSGEDFKGRKFNLNRAAIDLLVPLYVDDFREAMKEDGVGVAGAAIRTAPSLVGVGASTYKDSPEKPRTHAEKLARRLMMAKLPDEAREEAQIELDQKRAELRARSRRGEDVTAELDKLQLTERQRKMILTAKDQTRLEEDFKRLSLDEAATVYGIATREEKTQLRPLLEVKATKLLELPDAKREPVRRKLDSLGIAINTGRPSRPSRPARASRQ